MVSYRGVRRLLMPRYSEVLPLALRTKGAGLSTAVNWIICFMVVGKHLLGRRMQTCLLK
jgi:hypothetical protein